MKGDEEVPNAEVTDSFLFLKLKQFVGYEPRVGYRPRIPGKPWKRRHHTVSLELAREYGAYETPHIPALRLESKPGAGIAAQAEVVDQLRSDPTQKVQMPSRLPAPRTTVQDNGAGPPRQRPAYDTNAMSFPTLKRDRYRIRSLVGAILRPYRRSPSSDVQNTKYGRRR